MGLVTAHYIPGGDIRLDADYDRFGNRDGLDMTTGSEKLGHSWVLSMPSTASTRSACRRTIRVR